MNYRVQFTGQARSELKQVGLFIARDNPVRAETFVDELVNHYREMLSLFPETGRKVEGTEVRQLSYKGYTAFYEIDGERELNQYSSFSELRKAP